MKEFAAGFIHHMTIVLPEKLNRLDEQAKAIKKNYVTMSLFLECAGDPDLRAACYDKVISTGLLDRTPADIAQELPRIVKAMRTKSTSKTELPNPYTEV